MIEQKLEPITATYPQKAVSCKHKMQVQDGHPAKLDNRGSTAFNRQNSLKIKNQKFIIKSAQKSMLQQWQIILINQKTYDNKR